MRQAMYDIGRRIFVGSVLTLLFVLPVCAQVPGAPGYIKLDGLQCSSTDPRYSDWCEITGLSWGSSISISDNLAGRGVDGRGGQKASIGDIKITKYIDKSSPKLIEFVAGGKSLKRVDIVLLDRTRTAELLRITLTDVFISSVTYELTQEAIGLNFGKVVIEHVPSGVKGGWDLVQNKASA